jgi:hypothetical protein
MEYNFLVVYKPRNFHSMVDVFSQLLDATKNPEYLTGLLMHHCFYFNYNGYKKCILTFPSKKFERDIPWNNTRN